MTGSTPIRALPAHERPRERLAALGPAALSDAELVAIQLGTGGHGQSAVVLAQTLLAEWGGAAGLARGCPALRPISPPWPRPRSAQQYL